MALHQPLERSLAQLLAPLDLVPETDSFVSIERADLLQLARPTADPFAALVTLAGDIDLPPALLVAEPGLCTRVLASLWRSVRNEGAPLTQVEAELLRGFLADTVRGWRNSWQAEHVAITPTLALAGTMLQLQAQVVDGRWHIARTIVRELDGSIVGVMLFCYPAAAMPRLAAERDRIRWRSRVKRGLTDVERSELRSRLGSTLRDVRVAAPVTLRTDMPLGVLNALERGDVVTLDASADGFDLQLLDAPVTARFARSGDNLALVLTSPGEDPVMDFGDGNEMFGDLGDDNDPHMTGEQQ